MAVVFILAQSKDDWGKWGFRITVISSLVANLVVAIVSGTRRRSAPPGRWYWYGFVGLAGKGALWGAYQLAEVAATSAIGSLSLCGTDASEEEQQVAAFWGQFLLLHLGGPDNLTAYALEDNKMSWRKWFEIVFRILGMWYTIYDNTHRGGRSWGQLLAASVVMMLAGSVRYVERAVALYEASFDKMKESSSSSSSSSKDDDKMDYSLKCRRIEAGNASSSSSSSSCSKDDAKMAYLKFRIEKMKREGRSLSDRKALLLAQDLFPVWRHALVDSSVDPYSKRQQASEAILTRLDGREWGWENRCKVAEMELSLIYEFLYTKAILAHSCTWLYYLIRLLSPLSTAAAAFLFSSWLLHPDDNGGRRVVRGSFVGITYALLTVTFLMDVAWLLRALGSTWAYAYLRELAGGAGTRRWWCRLHRMVVRLDPLRLFGCDPVSHRLWSGTIGRYNLLHECSAARGPCRPELWPVSMAGDDKPKEMRYLHKLPKSVKRLLFERVTKILQEAIDKQKLKKDADKNKNKNKHKDKDEDEEYKKMYSREDIRTHWGQKAFLSAHEQVRKNIKANIDSNGLKIRTPWDEGAEATAQIRTPGHEGAEATATLWDEDERRPMFGTEFEEDVLLWHIATCMLLPHIRRRGSTTPHAWAIEVLSEYMMFLVAVRRQMLPGLVLHSQLQVTRETLREVWVKTERDKLSKLLPEGCMMENKEKLAMFLRRVTREKPREGEAFIQIKGIEGTRLLAHAVELYFALSGDKKRLRLPEPRLDDDNMLEFIFNVWVDKLVYAAVRCSREAHATQLSAGGDLTTVLWMLIQHAGPFCIGETTSIYIILEEPKLTP
ncbi:uncharacterized protein LOC120701813 [Panicum virgatum]|uniref:uncharacterized protein LOC120701813 n=1 Tax=Panicum virgatum TaxID=38727 RepID=UPI0019D588B7|nr:uncharacterized protein LOC120701813 [Panicum virgatum]